MHTIKIFAQNTTGRLRYILNELLKVRLGIQYVITNDIDEILPSDRVICYHPEKAIENSVHICSLGLLSERGLKKQKIGFSTFEQLPVIFTGSSDDIPFDLFSASFYLLSRYEEYLPHIRDIHDRFEASESIAFQHNFLKRPIIEEWCQLLRRKLSEAYPDLEFQDREFEFKVTVDIDNAYAYLEKGLIRSIGGYARAFIRRNFRDIWLRTKVLMGLTKDPYDTYAYQLDLIKEKKLQVCYFFLLGDYGYKDTNIPAQSKKFQGLVKSLADYAQIGIHPSYASNQVEGQLEKEIQRLNSITNREITISRQHYLKLNFPETYRRLIDLDIQEDYTMGYASQVGFRAGTCMPFFFYDIDMELETNLKIHPFAYMEGTLKYYMKNSPEEAWTKVEEMMSRVKAVNGQFICLWHNHSLNDRDEWKGWKELFEKTIAQGMAYEVGGA